MKYLLFNTASAVLYFGSQWHHSRDCKGKPQSLQIFEVKNPDVRQPPQNETWPAIYYRFSPIYPYSTCGSSMVDFLPLQCCVSNLTPEEADGYRSGLMVNILDEANPYKFASIEANGGKYCRLVPQTPMDVFGYKELYLSNDGSCQEFQLSCFTNGTFAVYPDFNCTGTPTLFDMTETPQPFLSEVLGDFQGTLMNFDKGKALAGWVEIRPGYLAVPQFWSAWEHIAVIAFMWSIGAFVFSLKYAVLKFMKAKTEAIGLLLASSIVLLTWICARIGYIYSVFPDSQSMERLLYAETYLMNIGTLLVCFYSASFLSSVQQMSSTHKWIMNISIFLVHMLFAGQRYFYPFFFRGIGSFLLAWDTIRFVWFVLWFLWDLVPVLVVAWKLLGATEANSLMDKIKEAYSKEKSFVVVVVLQILLSAFYFLISLIQNSVVLGSDNVMLAFGCYRSAIIATHAVLNAYAVETMKSFMEAMSKGIGKYATGSKGTQGKATMTTDSGSTRSKATLH